MEILRTNSEFSQPDVSIMSVLQFSNSLRAEIYEPAHAGIFDSDDEEFGMLEETGFTKMPVGDPQWYRTQSGHVATLLLEAEDDSEKLRLVQYLNGESQFRRFSSCEQCLFGPEEKFPVDEEDAVDNGFVPAKMDDAEVDAIISEFLIKKPVRGRGTDWVCNDAPDCRSELASNPVYPKRRVKNDSYTMDMFGNFVASFGTVAKKRTAKTIVNKKDPGSCSESFMDLVHE